jgi:hypothetical protein
MSTTTNKLDRLYHNYHRLAQCKSMNVSRKTMDQVNTAMDRLLNMMFDLVERAEPALYTKTLIKSVDKGAFVNGFVIIGGHRYKLKNVYFTSSSIGALGMITTGVFAHSAI